MKKEDLILRLEQGWVRAKIIIEMLGSPKKHIEDTLKGYVDVIEKSEGIETINKHFAPAEKKDSMFVAFVELDLLSHGLEKLAWLCFDYMPSSVEIIGPDTLAYKARDMQDLLNDMLARLHKTDLLLKSLKSENEHLIRNNDALMQNTVRLALKSGPKDLAEISKEVGLQPKHLQKFLHAMLSAKRLKAEDKKFVYVK